VKQILSVGIPNGLENGMFQIGRLLVLSLITTFGTNVVAANAIGNSIAGVINVPGQAIGLAMVVVIGQCMGAGNTKQAVDYTKKLMLAVYVLMGALCVLQFVLTDSLVGIFNLTPRAASIASQVLRYSAVFTALIWPLSFDLPNSLRASGDVVFPMVISLVSMFVCRVGLSYVLACDWGLNLGLLGVWLAMFADWIVRSVFFIVRFAKGKWKHKKVIG
ncbi:MAG: MATE family efflux transporter, partial [Eubacterium sp.]